MVYHKGYDPGSSSGGITQSEAERHEVPKPLPADVLRKLEQQVRTTDADPENHRKK